MTHIERMLHKVSILEVLKELNHVLDVVVHGVKEPVEPLQHIEMSLAEVLIELE